MSHHIPRSYKHAIATDPDRWMVPMQVEMDILKKKHTWDLIKSPPGANIMDSTSGKRGLVLEKPRLL